MHIFQVGAGSGGIVVLDLLARDPRVKAVTLVEPDVYKPHNVHRHVFPPSSVGHPKAILAAEWVAERRPDIAVEIVAGDLTDPAMQATFEQAVAACDLGVCAVDNEPAKYAFDALLRKAGKPWTLGEVLSGGIGGWVHRFTPGGPCYGCVASHLQRTVAEEPTAPAPDYSNPGGPVAETTVPASKASIEVIAGLHAVVTLELLASGRREPAVLGGLEQPAVGGGPEQPAVGGGLEQPAVGGGPEQPAHAGRSPEGGLEQPAVGGGPEQPAHAGRSPEEFTSLLFTLARVSGVFEEAFRSFRFTIAKSASCLICSAVPAPVAGEALDVALDQALARLGNH